jgi:phosphatidylglycerophosphatase A
MTMGNRRALPLATFFGAGYFPFASGTLATALTLPLIWLGAKAMPMAPDRWFWPCLAAAVLLFYPGVWAAGEAEEITGEHDSHKIVIDEVVGTLLSMAFLPAAAFLAWKPYLGAFFLFRLFDVWKPFPIRQSQILPRGWGVMVDDVLAGLVSGIILWLVLKGSPSWLLGV